MTTWIIGMAMMVAASMDLDADAWRSVNDGVMGGLSEGGISQLDEGLRFSGRLSLENNGGFSSARRLVEHDLSRATAVRLEVRGDGREYQFRIRQNNRFDGVAWRAVFPAGSEWRSVEIPFDAFIPVFRGFSVPEAGPVVAGNIRQIGFLLADKTPGDFELDIRRIEFVGPEAAGGL